MPLALLHSLLQQQSFYGRNAFVQDNDWTLTDLALAVESFKKVMTKCPCGPGVSTLVSQVYSNHCTDLADARVVEAHAKLLSQYAADPTSHVSPITTSEDMLTVVHFLNCNDFISVFTRHIGQGASSLMVRASTSMQGSYWSDIPCPAQIFLLFNTYNSYFEIYSTV
jgi:hypothetical protein